MTVEVHTVADDEVVLFDDHDWTRIEGLDPDHEYTVLGETFRTLPRPPGPRLATFATVNDVHFGEVECGLVEGMEIGPVLRAEPGEPPYPDVMNQAAVREIEAVAPTVDAVLAKGDLTTHGTPDEYQRFLDTYQPSFGDRLHAIWGNHDGYFGNRFADAGPFAVTLDGVVLAVIDTVIPAMASGRVTSDQLEWLDELAASADRPVLVFGHHHVWDPASNSRAETYFGINPDDSERLVELVARRAAICGYFAGHTHRNRTRRFAATGDVPWVEVAAVKDFPGSWAEYRVFEGGILQVHRRISSPEALSWSERCRAMFGGLYPQYAFGGIADRCFPIWPRHT
jgi:Icc protein